MSSYTTLPPNAQTQRCLRLQNHCHFSSWMPQKKEKSILLLGSKDPKRDWAVVAGKGTRAVGLFWSCGHGICFDSDFQEGAGREDVMGRGTQSCGDSLCLEALTSKWSTIEMRAQTACVPDWFLPLPFQFPSSSPSVRKLVLFPTRLKRVLENDQNACVCLLMRDTENFFSINK